MDEGRDSLLAHALQLGVIVAFVTLAVLLVSGPGPFGTPGRADAPFDPADRRFLIAAAIVVAASGGLIVTATERRTAALATATGVAIAFGATHGMAGLPPEVSAWASLASVPSAVLLLALVVSMAAHRPATAGERRLLGGLLGLGAVVSMSLALVFDPWFDPACRVGCTPADPLLPLGAAARLWLNRATDVVLIALAIATAVAAMRVPRSSPGLPATVVAAGAVVLSASLAAARTFPGIEAEGTIGAAVLAVAWRAGAFALAAGMAAWFWTLLGRRLRMRELARVLADTTAQRPAEEVVRRALGSDDVLVTYPLPAGGEVDPHGIPVAATASPNATTTRLTRDGTTIAILRHGPAVDGARLADELGPAALLALDVERLRAVELAALRELRLSRGRIVAAQDAERRRVERDLHDGAQQRILSVAMDLRLAGTRARRAGIAAGLGPLIRAEGLAFDLLDQLRTLARGVHPAILSEAGLGPALSSLAEETDVPLRVHVGGISRLPPLVEATAYRAVIELVRTAARAGAAEVAVEVDRQDGALWLDVELDRPDQPVSVRLEDRVGASGGRVSIVTGDDGTRRVRVVIPCA